MLSTRKHPCHHKNALLSNYLLLIALWPIINEKFNERTCILILSVSPDESKVSLTLKQSIWWRHFRIKNFQWPTETASPAARSMKPKPVLIIQAFAKRGQQRILSTIFQGFTKNAALAVYGNIAWSETSFLFHFPDDLEEMEDIFFLYSLYELVYSMDLMRRKCHIFVYIRITWMLLERQWKKCLFSGLI